MATEKIQVRCDACDTLNAVDPALLSDAVCGKQRCKNPLQDALAAAGYNPDPETEDDDLDDESEETDEDEDPF